MKSQGLAYFSDIEITIAAMFIFIAVFTGVVLWVHRKSAAKIYTQLSEQPFSDDELIKGANHE